MTIFEAAQRGNLEELNKLIKEGAYVNAKDDYGCTALMWAVDCNNVKCVNALLKSGADVSIREKNGWDALMWSAWNGHSECVDALIKAGANVNSKDNYGSTALALAVRYGETKCVALLAKAQRDLESKKEPNEKRYKIVESPDGKTLDEMAEIGARAMQEKYGSNSWDRYSEQSRERWVDKARNTIKALLGGEEWK